MSAELWLQIEVTGCPTICRHCWAQGIPYRSMPVDDIAWVLEQVHRFCDARGLGFGAYPMHELAAHPTRRSCYDCSPTTSARRSSSRCRPPGCR